MISRVLFAVSLLFVATKSQAITFLTECNDWYMRQTPAGLELRCRSTGLTVPPWLTIAGCLGASAKKNAKGEVMISCSQMVSNTKLLPK